MKYDLSKIMKAAHKIRKYMELYSLTHGVKTWADCLRLAWIEEKNAYPMKRQELRIRQP